MRAEQETTIRESGDEVHPAFAVIGASRITSTPGSVLFDSDILHNQSIIIRILSASRKHHLNHDWIHGENQYIEVELSAVQWASFVSSMNVGDGVPCTLRYRDGETIPKFPYAPRLAHSIQETRDAANKFYGYIQEAMEAYDALDPKAGAKERREALGHLRNVIDNAARNVEYVSEVLVGHAESVVEKSRADVEAFVITKIRQLGLEPSDLGDPLSIGGSDETD